MRKKVYKTSDIARELHVHVNTVRLYEEQGFLPPIPRAENGYRQYTSAHLEQARLVRMTLHWPYVGDKSLLDDLVRRAAQGDLGMAMEQAYQHLARVRVEKTYAEAAIEFLERWAAGYLVDSSRERMRIGETATYLNVTVDMLRNWERNGLIDVPRDDSNGYRLYGTQEFGRLRVIRMLVKSGYSMMAILKMLQQFDRGERNNLRDALNLPMEESANEWIEVIADRWLLSLTELEDRAQGIIRQIVRMMELQNTPS